MERYGEADKAALGPVDLGLGSSADAWAVPYWMGDAAFGVMSALLAAVDEGLGACMLGNFRGEAALASALGVPDGWRLFGAVALGRPDGADHRSPSLDRPVPVGVGRLHGCIGGAGRSAFEVVCHTHFVRFACGSGDPHRARSDRRSELVDLDELAAAARTIKSSSARPVLNGHPAIRPAGPWRSWPTANGLPLRALPCSPRWWPKPGATPKKDMVRPDPGWRR